MINIFQWCCLKIPLNNEKKQAKNLQNFFSSCHKSQKEIQKKLHKLIMSRSNCKPCFYKGFLSEKNWINPQKKGRKKKIGKTDQKKPQFIFKWYMSFILLQDVPVPAFKKQRNPDQKFWFVWFWFLTKPKKNPSYLLNSHFLNAQRLYQIIKLYSTPFKNWLLCNIILLQIIQIAYQN